MRSSLDLFSQRSLMVIISILVIILVHLSTINGQPARSALQASKILSAKAANLERSAICKKSDIDHCSQKLFMITDKNFHYPATLDEMNERCREMKSLGRCIRKYSQKCLSTSTLRHSFSLLIYGVSKTNKGLCRNMRRRRAFAAFGSSCANRLQRTMNGYLDDMNRALFGILSYSKKKMRIPLSCCNYYKFKNRVVDMFQEECPEHVGEIEKLLKGFTRDSLTFICGSYTEHSGKCSKIISKTPMWNETMNSVSISTYVDMLDHFIE